ncbi:hypothetical protein E5Q_01628 [Mixia osmundae IAM 14324]|uniref:DNA polymerase n=1 Tax=Mixia osmundae (strain CBS 9802 / IAM 14324 / JCM 22182 / KY 12970) TaxID=764103 RepID=G7DWL3_MIXOS|nr:hypothetical protein E5Q_01628 [Mixia osmundae IAM 14324]
MPVFEHHYIHVLRDKSSEEEVHKLYALLDQNGAVSVDEIETSEIVLTKLRSQPRLERSLGSAARDQLILREAWAHDSISAGHELPVDAYVLLRPAAYGAQRPAQVTRDSGMSDAEDRSHAFPDIIKTGRIPSDLWTNARYSCMRLSPRICINEGFVRRLAVIKEERRLTGNARSALSYAVAIAALKAYPHMLQSGQEADTIVGTGPKIGALIDEYLRTGTLAEADRLERQSRFLALRLFTSSVHGIGPTTARTLVDRFHCLTWDDVERTMREDPEAPQISLDYRDEIAQKIPRSEVEKIHDLVKLQLDKLQPGCLTMLTGGYRRGKPFSNDIDILITHPHDTVHGLLSKLVNRLQHKSLIKEILYYTNQNTNRSFDFESKARSSTSSSFDQFDKCFCIFLPPQASGQAALHRRLDLIVSPWENYWTGVVGWTGSTQFEPVG